MILSTLVISQLHFEMCAGLYGHPVLLKQKYWNLFAPWPHAFCNAYGFMMNRNDIAGSWLG